MILIWISAAVGAGMGIASGVATSISRRKAEKRQHEREKELRQKDKEDQYEMFNKTHHPKQVEKMKEAGLNPALMYGMGGGQGGTIGQVGGGAGQAQGTEYDIGAQAVQLSLMKAQKENIEADTEKKKVEAEKTGGVDTETAKSQQRSIEIDTRVKEAIGIDYLERQARIEIQRKNSENAQSIREFDAWMEEAFNKEAGEINADAYGSYSTSSNDLIRKAKRAGLEETMTRLEGLKKELILKDDEHTMNEIEIQIREFREDLSKLGLNEVSASILTKVLGLIFSRGSR